MSDEHPKYDPACGLTYHQWYRKHSPKYLAGLEERRRKNREYARARYADPESRERVKEVNRTYARSDKAKAAKKRWYDENGLDYHRKWREPRQKQLADSTRERYQNDLHHKLLGIARTRLYKAMKAQGLKKSSRTIKLVGCTLPELQAHIEAQFRDGMTWENYGRGGWHVDHIRPCSSFDLSDPEQVRQCFHYTNLQPLWETENLQKSDSWDEAA